ncbi:5'-nucleotidase [Cellulosimicrobium cellulans]|uniref:5'-nucleotidase n=1 Tax=Cellulosimicrobium cellulans TaxID=1710 RepID=UPI000848D2FD|nr:5'-nucleotidase [Cellulosimicrobium cellulans]
MGYDLTGRLVVGVAASALFDLEDSDRVLRSEGEAAYRAYQEEHLDDALAPGVAAGTVRRLLALNDLAPSADDPLVEVVVLSRRSPETGLRVMRSIRHHELAITRAVFRQGRAPQELVRPLHVDLFLTADEASVRETVHRGLPAGHVLDPASADEPGGELRVVFDLDGALEDGTGERRVPGGGALRGLLAGLRRVQDAERHRRDADPAYEARVQVALVTGRSAPAHERAVATLRSWGVALDDAFFLGGVDPSDVLEMLRPHVVVGERRTPTASGRGAVPAVHVPFGAPVSAPAPSSGATAQVAERPAPQRPGPPRLVEPVAETTTGTVAEAAAARPATTVARATTSTALVVPENPARPTGTRELPVLTRVPELTVLAPGAGGAPEDSRRGRRAGLGTGDGGPVERLEPKPLPVRQSSSLARHH